MWLVDIVTWKTCIIDETLNSFNSTYSFESNKCADKAAKSVCIDNGGKCFTEIDGYYIEVIMNVVYGIIWYQWAKRTLEYLQKLPISDWHVLSKPDEILEDQEEEKLKEVNLKSEKN